MRFNPKNAKVKLLVLTFLSLSATISADQEGMFDRNVHEEKLKAKLQKLDATVKKKYEWGTYRPNLYFGVRSLQEHSLSMGSAWFGYNTMDAFQTVRHSCEMDDKLEYYGYSRHDGKSFAEQTIKDSKFLMDFNTTFIKPEDDHWIARIKGTNKIISENNTPSRGVAFVLYFSIGGKGTIGVSEGIEKKLKATGIAELVVKDEQDDNYKIKFTSDPKQGIIKLGRDKEAVKYEVMARNIKQPEDRWNAKDIFMRELVGNAQRRFAGMSEEQVNRIMTEEHPSSLLKFRKFSLKNSDDYINNSKRNRNGNSDSDDDESDSDDDTDNDDNSSSGDEGGKMWRYNWVAIKISFEGEFEFKIEYSNASKEAASVTHEYKLDEEIVAKRREFDEKFERVFKLQERGYGEKEIGVAKTAFSNVMGGIGVFEGEEIVEEEKSIMAKARDKKSREKQREEAVGDEMKRRAERSVEEDALDRELELDLEMEIEKAQQNSKEKNSSDAAPTSDIKDEKPRIIFTGTPSRTFFPRGFLWDEGFHQLIVSEFDTDLSLLILNSWFDSMDKTSGWISREKIYGEEARSKVPKKFQVQNKHIANPPTLLMPVLKYLNILKQQTMRGSGGKARGMDGAEAVSQGSSGSGSGGVENEDGNDDIMMDPMEKAAINMRKHRQVHLSREQDDNQGQEQEEGFYLNNKEIKSIGKIKLYELYTKLKKNYEWYLNTQSEKIDSVLGYSNIELYKWNQGLKKGAAANRHHLLPSGLDDYPRCDYYYTTEQEVESKEKGNNGGGKTSKPVKRFHEICDGDKSEIDDEERLFLHVDLISWIGFMAKSLYEISDFLGLSADQMLYLEKYNNIKKYLNEIYYNKQKNMYCDIMLTTKTKTAAGTGSDTKKSSKSKIKHVCHKGYISLIPRLLLSPSSVSTAELLGNDIDMLTDPNELWSEFGIRSLSKSNPYYQQGENYWKGPIWVNINYLVLKSLHSGHHQNPHNNQEEKSDLATYNRLKANLVSTIVGSYNKTGNFWEQYNQDTGNGQRSHPFNGWTSLLVLIMADKY